MVSFLQNFLFSTIRLATPLIFASMGGLITRKSGSNNLALEGTMLTAALTGCLSSAYSGSLLIGLLGALGGGMLISLFLGFMSIKMESDMTMTCISVNTLANGLTIFIMYMLIGEKGTTIKLTSRVFPSIDIPLIRDIPFLGRVVSGHNLLTYLAFACVVAVWFLVFKTSLGLKIRAVGENPKAAESVGINVVNIKLLAFVLTGLFASLGGAFMSMGYLSWFSAGMIAGRGFIGMSAMNLAGARPFLTCLVDCLFALIDALAMTLQALNLPPEPLQMLPYLCTIIGLVLVAKHDMNVAKKHKQKTLKKIEE